MKVKLSSLHSFEDLQQYFKSSNQLKVGQQIEAAFFFCLTIFLINLIIKNKKKKKKKKKKQDKRLSIPLQNLQFNTTISYFKFSINSPLKVN